MILLPPHLTAASPSSPATTALLQATSSPSLLLRLRGAIVRRRRLSMTTRSASALPPLGPEPPPTARHWAARERGQLERFRSHLHAARLGPSLQPWLWLSPSYCPQPPFLRHRLHLLLWRTSSPRRRRSFLSITPWISRTKTGTSSTASSFDSFFDHFRQSPTGFTHKMREFGESRR